MVLCDLSGYKVYNVWLDFNIFVYNELNFDVKMFVNNPKVKYSLNSIDLITVTVFQHDTLHCSPILIEGNAKLQFGVILLIFQLSRVSMFPFVPASEAIAAG